MTYKGLDAYDATDGRVSVGKEEFLRLRAIIRAATEYRQVNAVLDSEPEPHPDPLARTILIEIGAQKQAALFAAVDGVGEGRGEG